jgi:hypothetical protein
MGGEVSGEDKVLGLVGDIYDAALDPNLWPVVLARIGDAVGGPHVLFGVYDPASGLSNLLSPRIDPDLIAAAMACGSKAAGCPPATPTIQESYRRSLQAVTGKIPRRSVAR